LLNNFKIKIMTITKQKLKELKDKFDNDLKDLQKKFDDKYKEIKEEIDKEKIKKILNKIKE